MDNLLIFRSQFKIILNWDLNTEHVCVKLSTYLNMSHTMKSLTCLHLDLDLFYPRK